MHKSTMEYAMKRKDAFYIDQAHDRFGAHVRWNSNDRIPFDDILEAFQTLGLISQSERDNSNYAREEEADEVLAEYRKNFEGYHAETLAEMRSEYGPGAKIVNVLTGTITQL